MSTQSIESVPPNLILSFGGHAGSNPECKVCLLEACSIPREVFLSGRIREWISEHKISDHPPDVCSVRASFGRSLNDSYGDGPEADAERTADLAPLELALRGTAARGDSSRVAPVLWDRSLRDWYPRSLEVSVALMRAACVGLGKYPDIVAACEKAAVSSTELVASLRALPEINEEGADLADLAALAAFAARAALADLADLADLAALPARAALAEADPFLKPAIDSWNAARREIRREMAALLLETCATESAGTSLTRATCRGGRWTRG